MSRFGGLGAGGVEIPSNLLISSGCLGLSGLNLTDCACGGGVEHPTSRGEGGALVSLGGLCSWVPTGLVCGAGGGRGSGGGLF